MGRRYIDQILVKYPWLGPTSLWGNKSKRGRWYKRRLAKARRKYARAILRGEVHPRPTTTWESEVDYRNF